MFMCLAIVYINIMYMTSDCVEQARGTSTIPGLLQTAFENVPAIFLFLFVSLFLFVGLVGLVWFCPLSLSRKIFRSPCGALLVS